MIISVFGKKDNRSQIDKNIRIDMFGLSLASMKAIGEPLALTGGPYGRQRKRLRVIREP